MMIAPVAYTNRSYTDDFIDCLIEDSNGSYCIYWYHWPRDGVFPHPDFEPVIYLYGRDKEELCLVVLRVGWRYRVFKHDELIRPIEVIFETPFHHPRIRTKENSEDFAASKERLVALPDNSARLRGVLPYLTVNGPPLYRQNIHEKIRELRNRHCRP
jgi:hypothetical protein